MLLQELKTQFGNVFGTNFTVKPCGREEVKKLIELAEKYDNSKNYGNLVTGFMFKDNLIDLYKTLFL